jgi:hypothetical protein
MDFMKDEGFKVLDVMTTGVGSEGNPHIIIVTMTKCDHL